MGEFNDGKAFAYQNTGESVMIFDDKIKIVGSIEDPEVITTLGLTSYNQSEDTISGVADPLSINGVSLRQGKIVGVYNGHKRMPYLVDKVVESCEVIDMSYETASIVRTASTVVAGATFETSSVAWHMKPNILKKTRQTNSWTSAKQIFVSNNYSSVQDNRKAKISKPLEYYVSASVYVLPEKYLIKNGSAFVDDNKIVPMGSGSNILEPLMATVEDYKPPSWGNTGSGSGVKSMIVVVQKYSYAQIYMAFDDTKILEVQGLPQGMECDKQFIKGTPLTSGVYNVKVKLDNLRTLEITMQVPELPRQL